jgi:hypothetical protein
MLSCRRRSEQVHRIEAHFRQDSVHQAQHRPRLQHWCCHNMTAAAVPEPGARPQRNNSIRRRTPRWFVIRCVPSLQHQPGSATAPGAWDICHTVTSSRTCSAGGCICCHIEVP